VEDQVVLGLEVEVDGALADAGGVGDLTDGGGLEPVLGEEVERGECDLPLALLCPPASVTPRSASSE
jgi:hypothetical protein